VKAYLDSSVVLRIIFGEPDSIDVGAVPEYTVASEILKIECFRTLDRMRHGLRLHDDDVAERSAFLHVALKTIKFIKLNDEIMDRASRPFPVVVKTLDAIHLSTALVWQQEKKEPISFFTHHEQLARAAKALGFQILGC